MNTDKVWLETLNAYLKSSFRTKRASSKLIEKYFARNVPKQSLILITRQNPLLLGIKLHGVDRQNAGSIVFYYIFDFSFNSDVLNFRSQEYIL